MNAEQISDYAQAREVAKWRRITDRLQLTSLAGIFVMIGILERVPKHTAHWLVWYIAAIVFILATAAYITGRKFIELQRAQWDRSTQRVKDMYDRFEQEYKVKIR